jgi:hypothetical protein
MLDGNTKGKRTWEVSGRLILKGIFGNVRHRVWYGIVWFSSGSMVKNIFDYRENITF